MYPAKGCLLKSMNRLKEICPQFLKIRFSRYVFFLFIIFLFSACTSKPTPIPVAPITGLPQGTDGYPWWNDTVFSEIFVRSYADSNADGIGDINGLIGKLDYLNDGKPETTTDLEVTGLWLMPVSPSPSYHGYDVTDYYAINPQYGTLDDFKRLLDEAHQRGMRVIIDLVMNHTSVSHPWFQESTDPASPRRNWYIWSDANPGYKGPWGEEVWHPNGKSYYYGIFSEGMPDLSYTNSEVRLEMEKVARFWLDEVGVDGFRLDAAKHIVEEGQVQENTDATHAWWAEFRQVYKASNPQAMTVGEVWSSTDQVAKYLEGDELDLAFNFDLAEAILKGVSAESTFTIRTTIESSSQAIPPIQFATFLTNHDQNRTMSRLGGDVEKAKLAASTLLTLPGAPFIYYGEEIGMTGVKPDENLRSPMQWSADANAGFTSAEFPWRLAHEDYKTVNVAAQTDDPDSLLSRYRNLVRLRSEHAALRVGEFIPVDSNASQVLAFLRVSKDETILVVHNLGKEPLSDYGLSLQRGPLSGNYQAVALFGTQFLDKQAILLAPVITSEGGFENYLPLPQGVALPAYTSLVIQLQVVK
jgi:alpha-amylase